MALSNPNLRRDVDILLVCNGLDIEAEGGANDASVLSVDLQHNGRLPGIIQPPI